MRMTYVYGNDGVWHVYKFYSGKYDKKGRSILLQNFSCWQSVYRSDSSVFARNEAIQNNIKNKANNIEIHNTLPDDAERCLKCREEIKQLVNIK